jgi:hypothetical protein
MDNMGPVTIALLTVFGGFIGGLTIVLYNKFSTDKQEKAIILLFLEESVITFKRCAMYYGQMLRSEASLSTLFEISDSATFTKLGEISSNVPIIETIMKLKASFFQVIRWADRASRIDPESQRYMIDAEAQSKAMVFFMGDIRRADNSYGRDRHKEYVKDIRTILDYLRRLNSQHSFANWLARVVPKLKTQTIALNSLMENMRKEIDTLETELDSLRLEEKEMWIAKGKDFTLNV